MEKIFISLPVWGESYLKDFLEYSLPNLLSGSAIPYLASHREVTVEFFTDEEAIERLKVHPLINVLEKYVTLEFLNVNNCGQIINNTPNAQKKFVKLNNCYYHTLTSAHKHNAPSILYGADVIFSSGTFARIINALDKGKRALMSATFRVAKEDFLPLIDQYCTGTNQLRQLEISSRDLVRLGLSSIHRLAQQYFWPVPETPYALGPNMFHHNAALLRFYVDKDSFICRSPVRHPLMFHPIKPCLAEDNMTCDIKWLEEGLESIEQIEVITDSDDLIGLDFSARSYTDPNVTNGYLNVGVPDIYTLAYWWRETCDTFHNKLCDYPTLFHASEKNITAVNMTTEYSRRVVQQIRDAVIDARTAEHLIRTSPGTLTRMFSYIRTAFKGSSDSAPQR